MREGPIKDELKITLSIVWRRERRGQRKRWSRERPAVGQSDQQWNCRQRRRNVGDGVERIWAFASAYRVKRA